MGYYESHLRQSIINKLADAAPLGKSRSHLSISDINAFIGTTYGAYLQIQGRITALDALGAQNGKLESRLEADLIARLGDLLNHPNRADKLDDKEMSEFSGAMWYAYDSLLARVTALDSGSPADQITARLETGDENELTDAAPLGRSLSTMSDSSLTEFAGSMWAAYNALDVRVTILEGAT